MGWRAFELTDLGLQHALQVVPKPGPSDLFVPCFFQESSTLVSIATCSLKCILTSDRGYPWLPFVQLVMLLRDYRDHFDPASCSTPQTLGIKERSDASITASQVTPSHTASGGHSLNRPHTSTPFHA